MLVLLLRVIFFTITTISNLITRAIFTFIAQFFVLVVRVAQLHGEYRIGIVEFFAKTIKSTLQFTIQLIIEILTNLILKMAELFKEQIIQSVSQGAGLVAHIIEKTKDSVKEPVINVPEMLRGLSDMITTMVSDMWTNYMQAMGYAKDDA